STGPHCCPDCRAGNTPCAAGQLTSRATPNRCRVHSKSPGTRRSSRWILPLRDESPRAFTAFDEIQVFLNKNLEFGGLAYQNLTIMSEAESPLLPHGGYR